MKSVSTGHERTACDARTKGQLIYPYGLDATWRGYTLLPPSTGCAGGYCSW